jgi:hypothetical protein
MDGCGGEAVILYLAGKYRGDIDANIQAAREVAIKLWEAGHFALCPHLNTAHFEVDCACPEEAYLQGDLDILARCDAIVMLEAWLDSEGAKREHAHALKLGIPVYYWPDMPRGEE